MNQISPQELSEWIQRQDIALLFFKTKACGVCQAQLSQIQALAEKQGVALKVVDLSENRHLAAEQMVLSAPVTKLFFEGKELFKEGAYLNFNRLSRLISQIKEE
jgi:thiol-disulfide isomerase/thioredoxin